MLYFRHFYNLYSYISNSSDPDQRATTVLTLSMLKQTLSLYKQARSRPAAELLDGWPEIQPVCHSANHSQ